MGTRNSWVAAETRALGWGKERTSASHGSEHETTNKRDQRKADGLRQKGERLWREIPTAYGWNRAGERSNHEGERRPGLLDTWTGREDWQHELIWEVQEEKNKHASANALSKHLRKQKQSRVEHHTGTIQQLLQSESLSIVVLESTLEYSIVVESLGTKTTL